MVSNKMRIKLTTDGDIMRHINTQYQLDISWVGPKIGDTTKLPFKNEDMIIATRFWCNLL